MPVRCPQCGADVEAGKPCPACLLKLAFLSSNAEEAATEAQATPRTHALPDAFGAYHPIGVLGEGGMGIVYLAEQERPIRRRVALKVIKQGMDTHEVIARFESERQALAMMDHPNIARVYDAGATREGRPYFVMEYVPGIPITDYCDKHLLGLAERLDLFRQVCQAIHHAHQKGVIHRDIKPSNVLTMIQDGKAVPKVIDFGVAKATHQRLTEKSLFTEIGVLIGTPAYMSPEQAEMSGLDVDTATDIYSLGVLLYELLVGSLPFDPLALRKAGYEEVRRIIREDEPPTPTARLSGLGASATEIARRRQTDVRTLGRFLRGDLDWITMKALDKDRTRRYASASEFAADITRHLQDEAVVARPASLGYRAEKFVRKHHGAVASVAALFLIVVLGFIVSTVFYLRSEAARQEADSQRRTAERQSYLANIAAADLNIQGGGISEARRRLELIGPALRGWEWRHLYLRTDSSVATLGGQGAVRFVAFSPDQSRIFWISEYGVVHTADASSYRRIPALTRPTRPPSASNSPEYVVAVESDGSRFLTSAWKSAGISSRMNDKGVSLMARHRPLSGEDANALHLTDAVSGALLRRLLVPGTGVWTAPGRRAKFGFSATGLVDLGSGEWLTMSGGGQPVSAIFSPTRLRLATWAWDNVLRIWDVATGEPIAAFAGHRDGISSAAFSPDGTRIVSGSYDGTARIWNLGAGAKATVLDAGAVNAVAFAPDGLRVASAGLDQVVRLWDVTGRSVAALTGHTASVTTVAFSPSGRELASGSADRSIRLWSAEDFMPLGILNGHTDEIASVAFSADGRRIVSGSADRTLRFWEPASARFDSIVARTDFNGSALAISRDSSRLALGQQAGGVVRIVNLAAPSQPLNCAGHEGPASSAVFNPAGSRLVSVSSDSIRVWDASTCNALAVLKNDHHGLAMAMDADGSRIAIGSFSGTLEVWDLSAGDRIWETDRAQYVQAIAFSPDGSRITAAGGSVIRVWDADRHEIVLTMTGHQDSVGAVAASPDGRWIASGSNDRTVRLWSASTGEPVATLTGHDADVGAVAFSPDSLLLVSGGDDRALRLWDVATREPILALRGHQGRITSVAFTYDGSRIVSGSEDGTVHVWESRLTHDPDAALLAGTLRSTLRFSTDVMGRLRADSSLDPKIRTAAIAVAEARGDDPAALNRESWTVVKAAGSAQGAYEIALRRAVLANEAAPWNVEFVHTLGAAQYRVKQYAESLSTMTRAASLRPEPVANDFVFTAMAHHQLGHRDEARAALDQVRKMLAPDPRRRPSTDADLQALDEEATALIGR